MIQPGNTLVFAAGLFGQMLATPTPAATGDTAPMNATEKMTAKMTARMMLTAGPTAYRRARSRRGIALIPSSSGSTNAPTGTMKKRRPREFSFTFDTRARIPWQNSWITIATASARIPYQIGM